MKSGAAAAHAETAPVSAPATATTTGETGTMTGERGTTTGARWPAIVTTFTSPCAAKALHEPKGGGGGVTMRACAGASGERSLGASRERVSLQPASPLIGPHRYDRGRRGDSRDRYERRRDDDRRGGAERGDFRRSCEHPLRPPPSAIWLV
eukprot:scaffold138699_cov31-Tisochrysis_lutea.AAC.1